MKNRHHKTAELRRSGQADISMATPDTIQPDCCTAKVVSLKPDHNDTRSTSDRGGLDLKTRSAGQNK